MEKVRGSSKVPKRKSLNDRFSAMNLELDDQLLIRRGRYHQSVTPYEENLDIGSPLVRYIIGGSPVAGKLASSGEPFTSPTVGSGKHIPIIAHQYGNASSPLSTLENLEAAPPVYRTPVKVDEEVLVIDDILVRSTPPGGKGGRSSSSGKSRRAREESGSCRFSSQCQFSYGNEELRGPTRFSIKTKSEAQEGKSSPGSASSTTGPRSLTIPQLQALEGKSSPGTSSSATGPRSISVPQLQVAAASEDHGIAAQPASPIEPKLDYNPAHPTTFSDWSPLDDVIECVLPHASTDKPPSREEVDAYIMKIMTGSAAANPPTTLSPLDNQIECTLRPHHASTHKPSSGDKEIDANVQKILTGTAPRRRLPVFVEICPND
ncbi:hypothetical protein L6164_036288 [Bauhinia variegata]|uniref:Uncharacterized protein n=1 Tax=Bauhinia variegata TaxID=167791 RepID=A0ACB9KGI2_BAUVA|nr:hypothetical protein L6164_036288 [Bauhinia variegata]